jgi:hypothetical protein
MRLPLLSVGDRALQWDVPFPASVLMRRYDDGWRLINEFHMQWR